MVYKLAYRNEKSPSSGLFIGVLAEKVGFEPTVMLPPRLISSQVHSTTLPLLLRSTLRRVTAANSIKVYFKRVILWCRPYRAATPQVLSQNHLHSDSSLALPPALGPQPNQNHSRCVPARSYLAHF